MKRLLLALLVVFAINAYSQTDEEIKTFRKTIVTEMDSFGEQFKPLMYFSTWFSDVQDALVIQVRITADIDRKVSAKLMYDNLITAWNHEVKSTLIKYGNVNYIKIVFIKYDGAKDEYKGEIMVETK
jgi:hypothetical protein